jgi:hypothetical protein
MSVSLQNSNNSFGSTEFDVLYLTHLNKNKIYLYRAQANVSLEHPVNSNFNTSSPNVNDFQNNTQVNESSVLDSQL